MHDDIAFEEDGLNGNRAAVSVGHVHSILPECVRGSPQPLAQSQVDIVFGELHFRQRWHPRGSVGDEGVEVIIRQPLQARGTRRCR